MRTTREQDYAIEWISNHEVVPAGYPLTIKGTVIGGFKTIRATARGTGLSWLVDEDGVCYPQFTPREPFDPKAAL